MKTRTPFMGTSEVASYLRVSVQRVSALLREGLLPTPLQYLASGPIWDAEAIVEFEATWDRQVGRPRQGERRERTRYVEVFYSLPQSTRPRTFCVVVEAPTSEEALEDARREVLAAHPAATDIEEWLQRTLTPAKAESVRRSFADGTWPGWLESSVK